MVKICQSLYQETSEVKRETMSVGISQIRQAGEKANAPYQCVDDYLYQSKSEGHQAITNEVTLITHL